MIVDCVSDLHGHYPNLLGGDLLIIAGDLTASDKFAQYEDFCNWIATWNNYRKVIVIAGNHDNKLQEGLKLRNCEYLCDSGTKFDGLKIWGSPWTKTFEGINPHCKAFTVDTEEELGDKFEKIPHFTDILITHSPAFRILDGIVEEDGTELCVGSKYLYGWFKYVGRPKLHVCGHIHEAYGEAEHFMGYDDVMVKHVNASYVNEHYQPVNKPIRIILERDLNKALR